MRPAYAIRITPDDVGKRVTVRTRIRAGPAEPGLTDTVGILRGWRDGRLTIERRDGSLTELSEADVVAARVVGRPPLQAR